MTDWSRKCQIVIVWAAVVSALGCAQDAVFRGHYVWGAEVRSFRPCGSGRVFWTSPDGAARELIEFYQGLGAEPYAAIFARVRGRLLGEAGEGFAADYDGLIRISEILAVSQVIPADCT